MPLLGHSSYRAPPALPGGHLQTIFPAVFRRVLPVTREAERITTPDGDFLDLDWNREAGATRLVIISHGLEGNSRNACIQGMARAFVRAGWDALAWSLRGCSGEPNRLLRSYHSGATDDLAAVIAHAAPRYRTVSLVGFSLGGNITLKYLGEGADPKVAGAVAFSVPCDLASSAIRLESLANRIYMQHFLSGLRVKILEKMSMFPGQVEIGGLTKMSTFREFDGAYTAPMNGFLSADDYWQRASSKPVLAGITVPALLVNALNDPFLPPACFPEEEAKASAAFHLETPRDGGHVGFAAFNLRGEYWSDSRAVSFLAQYSPQAD